MKVVHLKAHRVMLRMNQGFWWSEEKRGSDEDGDGRCLWHENKRAGYARAFFTRLETQPGHERRPMDVDKRGCKCMRVTDKPHSKK